MNIVSHDASQECVKIICQYDKVLGLHPVDSGQPDNIPVEFAFEGSDNIKKATPLWIYHACVVVDALDPLSVPWCQSIPRLEFA